MIKRLAMTLFAVLLIAVMAMGFAVGFCAWWDLPADTSQNIFFIYGAATAVAILLCVAGRLMKVSSLAYCVIIGGAVFLVLDFYVWQRFGLMPSVKFSRGGFPPAAIMGLFACALYSMIADPRAPQRFEAER